jgi:pSer/pThr/pTyr-binding forkhead associated (FHA) protein
VTGAPAAELEILTGPLAGRRLELRGETTVGRADTDLELTDGEVSRVHAVVRVRPDATVEVEDLGSTNGTFVDEARLTGATVLRPGSQLRIGSTVLRLRGGTETVAHDVPPPTRVNRVPPINQMRFSPPTVRRRHGERSAALLMGPTVLTFVTIGLTALALLVYFVAR